MDWNNDGKLDLITGEWDGHVRIYLNTGTGLGAYSYLQVGGSVWVDSSGFTKPEVCDWNNDGRKDLVVGDNNGVVYLLLNTGTIGAPAFASATSIYNGSSRNHWRTSPVVTDFDGDGKKDLLYGEYYGGIYYCPNTGTDSAPILGTPVPVLQGGTAINLGYAARPAFADWNGDGFSDLIAGNDNGDVYLFQQQKVNRAPTDLALSPSSIAENQPVGTTVGTFSTTDPDAGDTFTYSLVSGSGSTDNASFTISGSTLKSAAIFNYSSKNIYSIRVRTTDQGGLNAEKVFTVTVTNGNDQPTDIALSGSSVQENQPAGTTVGTLSTTDPDVGDTFMYSLISGAGSTNNASFTISGNTLKTAGIFDYESQSSYSIRVRSTDQGGLYTEKMFTIAVTHQNQQPTDIILSSSSVQENQPVGAVVGTFSSTDPDAGDTFTYTLVSGTGSADNTLFTISGSALQTAAIFNYESRGGYSIRVRTTDPGELYTEKVFIIAVSNANEQPTDLVLSSSNVQENQPVGTTIGTLSTIDPDSGGTFTYSLVGGTGSTDNTSFAIAGSALQTGATFNYEGRSSYSIRVRATDQGGLYTEKAFAIAVSNANEQPTDIALAGSTVRENQPVGIMVGSLSSTDPDAGSTFTYSLVSGTGSTDNALFTILGSTLKSAAIFNYDTQNSYSIRVRSTDQGGLYTERAFTIAITNQNQRPTDIILPSSSVQENQPVGTTVGTLSTTDPDATDTFTYSLVSGTGSTDNSLFTVSGNALKTATTFNYESQSSYSIRIRTADQGGLYTEKALTIAIGNAEEQPTDIALSSSSVEENQPVGSTVGTLGTTDPDAGGVFTYALVSGSGSDDNGYFAIDGDQLTTNVVFDYEARKNYMVRVRTTDDGGLSFEKAFAINVTDDATDLRSTFGLVNGKTVASQALPDADGDLVTFKLTGGGTGKVYGVGKTFDSIVLSGTTAASCLTITVKKQVAGDGQATILNISSDGLVKQVSGTTVNLTGQMLLNTLKQPAGKAAASIALRQISDAEIRVQGLPVSSITVSGEVSGSRIISTDPIKKFSAASLLDSDILVGVATSFAGRFAADAGDFANTAANLGSLTITGTKVPKGQFAPAYVMGSHISTPNVGTVSLTNVPAGSGAVVHVLRDAGTLKVNQLTPAPGTMFGKGSWNRPGARPVIWDVV